MANRMTTEEARQGTSGRRVLIVLIVSTLSAGILLALIQLYFSLTRDTGDGNSAPAVQEEALPEQPNPPVVEPHGERPARSGVPE